MGSPAVQVAPRIDAAAHTLSLNYLPVQALPVPFQRRAARSSDLYNKNSHERHCTGKNPMNLRSLLPSALIGAVASARSMTPMATIATARLADRHTPGELFLLDRPLFKYGALAMGVGELFGDKMKSAPDRTVFLGLLARVSSAAIAGAALAPRGEERAGAAVAVATAVPLAYLTLAGRKKAMASIGQTKSGLIEDALIVAAGAAVVAMATRAGR
jgi:uncharacterized membrane protein